MNTRAGTYTGNINRTPPLYTNIDDQLRIFNIHEYNNISYNTYYIEIYYNTRKCTYIIRMYSSYLYSII